MVGIFNGLYILIAIFAAITLAAFAAEILEYFEKLNRNKKRIRRTSLYKKIMIKWRGI